MVINLKNMKIIFYILKGLLVYFLFRFSVFFQYIPILLFKLDINSLSIKMQVALSTFSSIITLILLIIIYKKSLKEEFFKFKNNFLKNIDIGFKSWFIGLIIMIVSNYILLTVFITDGANNENIVQSMIKALPWIMLIDTGLIAPFNEEIVFRKTLKDIFKNKWLFILSSFLLFGAVHVIGSATCLTDYLYIIPYGALGGAFAYAYYKTDTIYTSMFMHMFHNTILTLASILLKL